jgi:AraC family transcriptional regulator
MQQRLSTREDYSRRINVIVEYINNHLADDIDLEVLAGISSFSPYHLHHIVKAFLGEPIGAFITRVRVETAARLLRYTDMPVNEIAYRVGYEVPSSLSKVFKQFYDITPTDYKNNKTYTIMKPFKINSSLELSERIVNLEPQQAIYLCLIGDYKKNNYCEAWKKLWQYVRTSGKFSEKMEKICQANPNSEVIEQMLIEGKIAHVGIYHDDPKVTEGNKQRADICLVLPFKMEPKGEIGVKEIAGGKYVVYRYQGSYDHLDEVYDTVYGKYIPENGYQIDARPGFEVYLNDPECTQPDKMQTEIYVPIL